MTPAMVSRLCIDGCPYEGSRNIMAWHGGDVPRPSPARPHSQVGPIADDINPA